MRRLRIAVWSVEIPGIGIRARVSRAVPRCRFASGSRDARRIPTGRSRIPSRRSPPTFLVASHVTLSGGPRQPRTDLQPGARRAERSPREAKRADPNHTDAKFDPATADRVSGCNLGRDRWRATPAENNKRHQQNGRPRRPSMNKLAWGSRLVQPYGKGSTAASYLS